MNEIGNNINDYKYFVGYLILIVNTVCFFYWEMGFLCGIHFITSQIMGFLNSRFVVFYILNATVFSLYSYLIQFEDNLLILVKFLDHYFNIKEIQNWSTLPMTCFFEVSCSNFKLTI